MMFIIKYNLLPDIHRSICHYMICKHFLTSTNSDFIICPIHLITPSPKTQEQPRRKRRGCISSNYLNSVKWVNTEASVLATVDMVLMKMSRATPTTSLRVSPTVSPVTEARWAGEPLPWPSREPDSM